MEGNGEHCADEIVNDFWDEPWDGADGIDENRWMQEERMMDMDEDECDGDFFYDIDDSDDSEDNYYVNYDDEDEDEDEDDYDEDYDDEEGFIVRNADGEDVCIDGLSIRSAPCIDCNAGDGMGLDAYGESVFIVPDLIDDDL